MKKDYSLKFSVLLIALTILISVFSSCGNEPSDIRNDDSEIDRNNADTCFAITYELGEEFTDVFYDLQKKANSKETVEIKTTILYDADIHVYVDGQEICKTHYGSDYWGYSFVMPEKDVTVTARFFTDDEVFGITAVDESNLREKYPEYFDLPTDKGLEVYVWQMGLNSYDCGIMEGTNREKTPEELINLKGASIDEMKSILSSYNIPKDNIFIIPWQNPISSFLADYWTSMKDEDPESIAKRRQEYINMLRKMLIGDEEPATKVAYANWTDNNLIYSACLNYESIFTPDSSVRHFPIYKIDTKGDLELFKNQFEDILTFDHGYNEVPSFNDAVSEYDDSFFAENSLILAYVTAGSGSLRFGIRDIYIDGASLCVNVVQTNNPEVGTTDMAGWLVMAEVSDRELENISDYDARMVAETVAMPEDFAFSIVWGTFGISSYDSKSGTLIKTKDATDVSKYTCNVLLTEDKMKDVYRILFSDIDIFQYPDSYDPFNAPDAEIRLASEPNQTIIISVTANSQTKTVTCNKIAFGSLDNCYSDEAAAFMNAENEIVEILTSLPEWAAFPEYEFFYE